MSVLFNNLEPVSIPKKEYASLIKDHERVEILKRILKEQGFLRLSEMKAILEMDDVGLNPKVKNEPHDASDYIDYDISDYY